MKEILEPATMIANTKSKFFIKKKKKSKERKSKHVEEISGLRE